MSQHDDIFYRNFGLVLAVLTAITLFLIIFANSNFSSDNMDAESAAKATAANIKPVSAVNTAEIIEEAPVAVAQTPEEMYTSTCSVCHVAGVSGAPKPDDNAAWGSRYDAKGLDGLTASVISGLNAMPPRAGTQLSDEDLKAAVKFMLEKAGVEVSEQSTAPAAATLVATATEAVTTAVAPVAEKVEAEVEAVVETAVETVEQVTETVTAAVAPAAEQVEEAAAVTAISLEGFDLSKGESTYRKACFACHDAGVAGAPKLGDAASWGERFDKGIDTMVQSSLKGLGGMPPKGGHMYLSDEDVKNGVAYMISKSVK